MNHLSKLEGCIVRDKSLKIGIITNVGIGFIKSEFAPLDEEKEERLYTFSNTGSAHFIDYEVLDESDLTQNEKEIRNLILERIENDSNK